LARELVTLYHTVEAAKSAEEEFDRLFAKKGRGNDWSEQLPEKMPEHVVQVEGEGIGILALLVRTELAASRSDARRLIEQGGVLVDGKRITDYNALVQISESAVLKVGKRRFARAKRQQ
ncbi:MAG: S4 domain-containing protein, partial [Bacteroidota bacterium]